MQNDFKTTPAEKLLKEIEQLLNPIRKKAKYVTYGTGSKSVRESTNQFEMSYQGFKIKVQIF